MGLIEFDNVQLRYGDNEPLTLNHTSFTINSTEKIGTVTNSIRKKLIRFHYSEHTSVKRIEVSL